MSGTALQVSNNTKLYTLNKIMQSKKPIGIQYKLGLFYMNFLQVYLYLYIQRLYIYLQKLQKALYMPSTIYKNSLINNYIQTQYNNTNLIIYFCINQPQKTLSTDHMTLGLICKRPINNPWDKQQQKTYLKIYFIEQINFQLLKNIPKKYISSKQHACIRYGQTGIQHTPKQLLLFLSYNLICNNRIVYLPCIQGESSYNNKVFRQTLAILLKNMN
eukprot:TRINITY_DN1948_c0_g1_i8.p1 TRINITY_DN1948_c0_g1~~TRINITY_DN1948_c0_g1_i8.p1  ORF type:complete len:216 (-),score=-13.50 TRINITY_DN1948_c0_g1_i8:77-724(-)